MKTIKKLLALTLVLCMVFCLSVAVFADNGDGTSEDGNVNASTDANENDDSKKPAKGEEGYIPVDEPTVKIKKTYTVENKGTTAPATTFYLYQEGTPTVSDSTATSGPDLVKLKNTDGTDSNYVAKAEFTTALNYSENDSTKTVGNAEFEITLPIYTAVGIYTYTLKETDSNVAGIDYFNGTIKLVVTVINDDTGNIRVAAVHTETNFGQPGWDKSQKNDTINNTYKAGSLSITKTVTGNLGNKTDKYFEFKVNLTGVTGDTYAESYAVTGGSEGANNPATIEIGKETTFKLKHGDTITIANLPYGVSYTVTETAENGYTTTKTGDTGSINAATQTAAFVNNKEGNVDMGVTMDSLPYILALAVAFGGAVVLFTRKRHVED